MNGKELLLVLAGTATAAAAGGIGAAALVTETPANGGSDAAVLEQLEKLGASLDGTNEIMTASRDEIVGLKNRINAVESGLRGGRAARGSSTGRRHVDLSRGDTSSHVAPNSQLWEAENGEAIRLFTGSEGLPENAQVHLREALGKLAVHLGDLGGDDASILGTTIGEDGEPLSGLLQASGQFRGLFNSSALRRLPEAERWEKARDEIGLSNIQEDEIKSALAERDKAIEESMEVERDESGRSTRISVRSMDLEKTRAANQAYRRRVDNTLNDDQRKNWSEKGYDNAFGQGSMGVATVISIGTSISTSSGDE